MRAPPVGPGGAIGTGRGTTSGGGCGRIPAGTTLSYTELAEAIGSPKAVRAVASACAANAHAVLIPCHRVVRTDGSLSGYRWGIERKRTLIDRERASRR